MGIRALLRFKHCSIFEICKSFSNWPEYTEFKRRSNFWFPFIYCYVMSSRFQISLKLIWPYITFSHEIAYTIYRHVAALFRTWIYIEYFMHESMKNDNSFSVQFSNANAHRNKRKHAHSHFKCNKSLGCAFLYWMLLKQK